MRLLKNHCWCSKSNWDGEHYESLYILSIDKKDEDDILTHEITKVLDSNWGFVKKNLEERSFSAGDIEDLKRTFYKYAYNLKPEVFNWLMDNVKDNKEGKAWCIGNEEYRSSDGGSFSIFFQRKSDVYKFVKKWSKKGKLSVDFNYFTDTKKTWCEEKGKYLVEKR